MPGSTRWPDQIPDLGAHRPNRNIARFGDKPCGYGNIRATLHGRGDSLHVRMVIFLAGDFMTVATCTRYPHRRLRVDLCNRV